MSLKLRESWHVTDKYREKRRGRRMNSRVPVRLEWDLPSGKRVKAEAHTRVVNPYGCMVVLDHDLPLEHRVALTNVPMNAGNAAVTVTKIASGVHCRASRKMAPVMTMTRLRDR